MTISQYGDIYGGLSWALTEFAVASKSRDLSEWRRQQAKRSLEFIEKALEALNEGTNSDGFQFAAECNHPECREPGVRQCENCEKRFCSDHGQKGGDQEVADVGMVAVPAICDACIDRSRR